MSVDQRVPPVLPVTSPSDRGPGERPPPAPPRRRRRRLRRALLVIGTCLLLLVAGTFGTALYLQQRLAGNLERIPSVFSGLTDRPAKPATGAAAEAMNILLLGTDRRSDVPTTGEDAQAPAWVPGAQRSDTLMLLHIDGDRRGLSVISVPRDAWVDIPGHGKDKINAAFSYAGPSLAIETVEQLTGVRVDHLAVVDWEGFAALTDALGGVTVTVPETVHDSARDITWTAGEHTLDGEKALAYVGERYGLPGGDLDRVRRQQHFLRLLMRDTLEQELLKQPTRAYGLLDTVTRHLSVDSGWSVGDMRGLLLSLRHLRTYNISYLTVPVRGTGRVGAASVVFLDEEGNDELWRAVRDDRVAEWLAENPDAAVPEVVR